MATNERGRLGSRAGSSRQCRVAASVDFFEAQGRLGGAGRLDLLDDGQHLTADSVLRGASLDPRLATGWRAVAQNRPEQTFGPSEPAARQSGGVRSLITFKLALLLPTFVGSTICGGSRRCKK